MGENISAFKTGEVNGPVRFSGRQNNPLPSHKYTRSKQDINKILYPVGWQSAICDDTLLFLENNVRVATNFKWILTYFEQLSGMHINYHKS
jgi:hypothetical protein